MRKFVIVATQFGLSNMFGGCAVLSLFPQHGIMANAGVTCFLLGLAGLACAFVGVFALGLGALVKGETV